MTRNSPHRVRLGAVRKQNQGPNGTKFAIRDITRAVNGYVSVQPFPNRRTRRAALRSR